ARATGRGPPGEVLVGVRAPSIAHVDAASDVARPDRTVPVDGSSPRGAVPLGVECMTSAMMAANPMPAIAGIDRNPNFQTHTVVQGTSAEHAEATESGNRSSR